MNTCACTWHWTYRQDGRRVEPHEHMAGICPLYVAPAKPACTCHLHDVADQVVDELHEDDCARRLKADHDADERVVRAHERRNG